MLPAFVVLGATTGLAPGLPIQDRVVVRSFDLADVTLRESPFSRAHRTNAEYLLRLEPDRFLHGFRKNAGLTPKAAIYGGWESQGVAGQTLGHYMSALAQEFRATGDVRFAERARYIVAELALAQQKREDGYVGAIPDGDRIWTEIRAGKVTSRGFDLNGGWVPWYTMHKMFAGLLDIHRHVGDAEALKVARRLGDWAIGVTANLDDEKWQRMLAAEHGGMNESLAELSVRAGEPKYLALSRRFDHRAVLEPLAEGKDDLAGKHANTQVPKVIGLARLYEIEGKPKDRRAAETFWERVTGHHSYANGGNSDHEHFGAPNKLADRLSDQTSETCNTYNMLKLTRRLVSWRPEGAKMDFYERALYNHILASQHPGTGMFTYYVPLGAGMRRTYSSPDDSFWCCVGTGMENHTKYGEAIYSHRGKEALYVDLFIPSDLNYKAAGIKLRQETKYPEDGKVTLSVIQGTASFEMAIREPAWARGGIKLTVNGKPFRSATSQDGYARVRRSWRKGDVVKIEIPMTLRAEAMPDDPNRKAFLYGPLLLAADLRNGDAGLARYLASGEKPLAETIRRVPGEALAFRVAGEEAVLRPFWKIVDGRYIVYFDEVSAEAKAVKVADAREAEREAKRLEAITVDQLRVGEQQSETDHALKGERTGTGDAGARKWRHATDGGWFEFELAVDPETENELRLTYWGSDGGGRDFTVLVGGTAIAEESLKAEKPDAFFDRAHALPKALTAGKRKVIIRLQAKPGQTAGGIFGARMVRR